MEYQVSARKYRPGTFQDVIGQPHVVQTLQNAITGKRVAHAYLFSGMRGVGKTTVARILSKALNCEEGPTGTPCDRCPSCVEITQGRSVDVIEIDGASNTGVDDVRELRENVKFAPFRGSYRVYIIDEVHMLSNSAFNALLKTLEEPPAHAVFVFATTEIHKIPATILSRCQHFNFRRIPRLEIVDRLRQVVERNATTIDDRSLTSIARASDGSMRDALSLLDQAVAFGGDTIRHEDVEGMLGSVPDELVRNLVFAIVKQETSAAVALVGQVLDQGYDLRAYCGELVERIRNLLVAAVVPSRDEVQGLIDLPVEEVEQTITDAKTLSAEQFQELFAIFSRAEDSLRGTAHPRFLFEVAVVRATRLFHTDAAPVVGGEVSRPVVSQTPVASQTKEQSVPVSRPVPKAEPNRPTRAAPAPQSVPQREKAEIRPQSREAGKQSEARLPERSKSEPTTVAEKPEAPAAKPDGPSATDIGELNWEPVVERVVNDHPNIGTFLEMGRLVNIEGNQVTIGYPKTASVAFSRIRKDDNRSLVADVCKQVTGRSVYIKVIELGEDQAGGPTMGQIRATKKEHENETLLEEVRANPFVKQALEVFGGEVIEARRVPPKKEVS